MPPTPLLKWAKQQRAQIDLCSRAGRKAAWDKVQKNDPKLYKALCKLTGQPEIDLKVPEVIVLKDIKRSTKGIKCKSSDASLYFFWGNTLDSAPSSSKGRDRRPLC